jgi:hypothetical protein
MFYKEVNLKNPGEMIAFLKKHFRYHTMNSWNKSTSYANNIKLYNIEKPPDVDDDKWCQMLGITEWQEKLSDLLEEFGRRYNWLWQAGINGRSGGYVILYRGGIKPSGYKSFCIHCGQKNCQAIPVGEIGVCGRCDAKARINFKQEHMQVFTWPGQNIDMGEDFRRWDNFVLKERVELVQEFDRLGDTIVDVYIETCRDYRIVEEEILVPKTVRILEPA